MNILTQKLGLKKLSLSQVYAPRFHPVDFNSGVKVELKCKTTRSPSFRYLKVIFKSRLYEHIIGITKMSFKFICVIILLVSSRKCSCKQSTSEKRVNILYIHCAKHVVGHLSNNQNLFRIAFSKMF